MKCSQKFHFRGVDTTNKPIGIINILIKRNVSEFT